MLIFFLYILVILRCACYEYVHGFLVVRTHSVGMRQGWQRAGECMKG